MNRAATLQDIQPGERAVIHALASGGRMRRRLLDLGLIEGTEVECIGTAPSGDPRAFFIRGAVIALRAEDCRDVLTR